MEPEKKTFRNWLLTIPTPGRDDIAGMISVLDPSKATRSNSNLRAFVARQQPRFEVESQLIFLANLICSDDADYAIATRIVGAVTSVFRDRLVSGEQYKLFSSKLQEAKRNRKCSGIEEEDDDLWGIIDRPEDRYYYDLTTKPVSGLSEDDS